MDEVDPYLARLEAIGLGIESEPGVAVPPQIWLRWLTHGLQARKNTLENESAMGVVDRVNDSAVTSRWLEGTVGGKVTAEGIGFLLLGFFGSVASAASGEQFAHTFAVSQSSTPTALTIARKSPIKSERHSYGTLDNLEITAEENGYVQFSTAIKARIGSDSTDTIAFAPEREFTSEHIRLQVADLVAGLTGAVPVDASRLQLVLERSSEARTPLGTVDTPNFERGVFDARGEFVVRVRSDAYSQDFLSNAIKALRITLENQTDKLVFTAGKARYRELEKSTDRDQIVTATVQFACELDLSTSKSIDAVLTNSREDYVPA